MADLSLLLVAELVMGRAPQEIQSWARNLSPQRAARPPINNEVKSSTAVVDGRSVAVVDGPGLGDGSFDNMKDVDNAISLSKRAFNLVLTGFNAILIILKYGVRFTQQEKDALAWIKSIFGENVIRNHGVVVLTHGDSFELDTEDEDTTFDQWCKEQTGDVQALFKECKQRRVLFNNRTKDSAMMKRQVNELFSKVKEIQSGQKPYTMEDFNRAESGRTRLLVRAKLPQLQRKTEFLVDEIDRELQKLDDNRLLPPHSQLQELGKIRAKVEDHKNDLRTEDHNTGTLNSLLLQISVTETTVKSRIDRCNRQIEQETLQRDVQRHSENYRKSWGKGSEQLGSGGNIKGPDDWVKKVIALGAVLLVVFLLYWIISSQFASPELDPVHSRTTLREAPGDTQEQAQAAA